MNLKSIVIVLSVCLNLVFGIVFLNDVKKEVLSKSASHLKKQSEPKIMGLLIVLLLKDEISILLRIS